MHAPWPAQTPSAGDCPNLCFTARLLCHESLYTIDKLCAHFCLQRCCRIRGPFAIAQGSCRGEHQRTREPHHAQCARCRPLPAAPRPPSRRGAALRAPLALRTWRSPRRAAMSPVGCSRRAATWPSAPRRPLLRWGDQAGWLGPMACVRRCRPRTLSALAPARAARPVHGAGATTSTMPMPCAASMLTLWRPAPCMHLLPRPQCTCAHPNRHTLHPAARAPDRQDRVAGRRVQGRQGHARRLWLRALPVCRPPQGCAQEWSRRVHMDHGTLAVDCFASNWRAGRGLGSCGAGRPDPANRVARPTAAITWLTPRPPRAPGAISDLAKEYQAKGVAVVSISSNSVVTHPQDGPDAIAKEAKELGEGRA